MTKRQDLKKKMEKQYKKQNKTTNENNTKIKQNFGRKVYKVYNKTKLVLN